MYKGVLQKRYENDILQLKNRAKQNNVTEVQFSKILNTSINRLIKSEECSRPPQSRYIKGTLRIFVFLVIVSISAFVTLNVHQPTSSYVLRNVQGLIHPGLKIVRFLSMPIINNIPSLTGLYDETCLIENPYFYVNDMDCWPCKNVHTVIDLTGFSNLTYYKSGHPYVAKTNQRQISFSQLKSVLSQNKDVFEDDLTTLKSNDAEINSISSLIKFSPKSTASANTHVVIRINRMSSVRIIRQLFPKPIIIGDWSGQSIERYLIIDEPNSDVFLLPQFECSFVFIVQAKGERNIVLKPSRECGNQCKTVSVLLKPSYVLWYNWWYWRPISLPKENSTDVSISYINSYC